MNLFGMSEDPYVEGSPPPTPLPTWVRRLISMSPRESAVTYPTTSGARGVFPIPTVVVSRVSEEERRPEEPSFTGMKNQLLQLLSSRRSAMIASGVPAPAAEVAIDRESRILDTQYEILRNRGMTRAGAAKVLASQYPQLKQEGEWTTRDTLALIGFAAAIVVLGGK